MENNKQNDLKLQEREVGVLILVHAAALLLEQMNTADFKRKVALRDAIKILVQAGDRI